MTATVLRIAELAERVRAGPARCGGTRLVCVDGPSGSGSRCSRDGWLPRSGGPPVVHMDDLYPGWDGLAAAVPLLYEQIVAPLAAGRPAGYRRYDWDRGGFAETPRAGPARGAGGGGRGGRGPPVAPYASLLVWVEAPRAERFRRGIARDGETYRPHWERWAEQEAAHFAAEGTRDRADLRVDGAPGVRPRPGHRARAAALSAPAVWTVVMIRYVRFRAVRVRVSARASAVRRPARAEVSDHVGVLRTKSIEQSIADTDEPEYQLKKNLTALDLTVFGVGVIIGAGIFTLTGRAAATVSGPAIVLSFVVRPSAAGWPRSATPSSPRRSRCPARPTRSPTPAWAR